MPAKNPTDALVQELRDGHKALQVALRDERAERRKAERAAEDHEKAHARVKANLEALQGENERRGNEVRATVELERGEMEQRFRARTRKLQDLAVALLEHPDRAPGPRDIGVLIDDALNGRGD